LAQSEAFGWRNGNIIFSIRPADNLANVFEAPLSLSEWKITAAPHRLTFGTAQEESPSVTADGSLVFASVASNLDVYTLPIDANRGAANGPPQRRTRDLADDNSASLSSDGSLMAFQSLRSGQSEIWIEHLADGKEERLANGEVPVLSPDGTTVAFTQDGKRLMTIPAAGGVGREIVARPLEPSAWSPDQSLLLAADYGSKPRVPIEVVEVAAGKARTYLTHPRSNLYPRGFSPDGRWFSFSVWSPSGSLLMVAPFRASAPPPESEWIAVGDPRSNDFNPRWSPNGQILYFISERDGFACIWARPMDAATQKPRGDAFAVLHLHGAALQMRPGERFLSVAKDKLAFSMEERAGSIWSLHFKKQDSAQ
jgi:Tol biopolymer transport system component